MATVALEELQTEEEVNERITAIMDETGCRIHEAIDHVLAHEPMTVDLKQHLTRLGMQAAYNRRRVEARRRNPGSDLAEADLATGDGHGNGDDFGSQPRDGKTPSVQRSVTGGLVPSIEALQRDFHFLGWQYTVRGDDKPNYRMSRADLLDLWQRVIEPQYQGMRIRREWVKREIELLDAHGVRYVWQLPREAMAELDGIVEPLYGT